MIDERALAFVRELERADEAAAATLVELDELARAAESVRTRAVVLEGFVTRLPAERERIARALADAERDAVRGRDALARAEAELDAAERGRDAQRLAAARRTCVRSQDALRMAERKVEAARADSGRIEAEAEEAEREQGAVEDRARELAQALAARPALAEQAGGDPAAGLAGAAEWASRARAALFVARGGLMREREALIRQANELGALVLGEPLTSASPALVARRVEQASNR